MHRKTIAAVLIIPVTFALASAVAQAQDRTRAGALIDQKLREAVERKQVPGVVALRHRSQGCRLPGRLRSGGCRDRPTPGCLIHCSGSRQ